MAKRVLIVEDEESVAFFLSENLVALGLGYQVEAVASAEEALSKMTAQPFDLLITDMCLPGMSGLELIRSVRQVNPYTRLILITAYGNARLQTEAQRLMVSQYITKPFPMDQFIHAAQEALLPAAI